MSLEKQLRTCLALVGFALAGCGDGDRFEDAGSGGSAGTSSGGGAGGPALATVVLNDANNYSLFTELRLPAVGVEPERELSFEWGRATRDLRGRPIDPLLDIDTVHLLVWKLDESDFLAKAGDDSLTARDLGVPGRFPTQNAVTSASLFDFFVGTESVTREELLAYLNPEQFPADGFTHMAVAARGDASTSGGEALLVQTFRLDPDSTNTTVAITNESSELKYAVDLASLEPVCVAAGEPNLGIDWQALTRDARGRPFSRRVTEVHVARFDESPAELAGAAFLELDSIGEEYWSATVSSGVASLPLATLETSDGRSFPGISLEGTWLLALGDEQRRLPDPPFLTVLEPCAD